MQTRTEGDILKVLGLDRLSATNSGSFKDLVKAQMTEQHRVIEVDSARIAFVDSEGLGALVSLQRAMAAQNGHVRMLNPLPIVRQFLKVVHFHRILEIAP